jgi:hypothetical protein
MPDSPADPRERARFDRNVLLERLALETRRSQDER